MSKSISEATELLRKFSEYDILEAYYESDIEIPEGERFYDPIYEEVWG